MTKEEQREYKREWMRKLRATKVRVFIKTESATNHGYRETYIEKSPDMPAHCPYCTMLLSSEWHIQHPCASYEVVMILNKEDELNGGSTEIRAS